MKLPWRKKNKSGDADGNGNGNGSYASSSTSIPQNDNRNVKSTAIQMKHDSDFVVVEVNRPTSTGITGTSSNSSNISNTSPSKMKQEHHQPSQEPTPPSSPATASSTLCCGQYDIASTTKDGTPIQLVVLDETTTSSTTTTTTASAPTGNESSSVVTNHHRNDNDCIVQSGSSHSSSSSSMDEYVFMTPLQSAELFEDSATTIVIDNSTTNITIPNHTNNKTFQTVDNALASSSSLSKCLQTAESTLTEDTAMTDGTITPTTVVDDVDDTNHETGIIPTPILEQQTQSQSNQGHPTLTPITFLRHSSSFLRVSDLVGLDTNMDLSEHSSSCHGGQKIESIPNYHCCSELPPPGIPHDPIEKWVALDDGTSYNSNNNSNSNNEKTSIITPIAQYAVDALANTALRTMYDHQMWEPDSKTMKIIEAKTKIATTGSNVAWEVITFQQYNCDENQNTQNSTNMILEDHILIWTGTFGHGLYGSDIPAIRSAAVIHMSSKDLVQLLMDSNRVQEYNTMSLGRKDLLTLLPSAVLSSVLPTTTNGRPILTKVMRSESRPPLLRKTLQFTSILHVRELDDDGTFLLVTRAVEKPKSNNSNSSNSNVIVSEILLGVNVIKKVPSHYSNTKESCILLSVNHVRSPMVPLYIAKRLGLQAATNFVNDLRKCC